MDWIKDLSGMRKDGTPYLVKLKNPLPKQRDDLWNWAGVIAVMRHPGLPDPDRFDLGWNFAAPVGHGGFPDDWIESYMTIPGWTDNATYEWKLRIHMHCYNRPPTEEEVENMSRGLSI